MGNLREKFKKGTLVKLSEVGRAAHIKEMELSRGFVDEDSNGSEWVKVLWNGQKKPFTEHITFIAIS